MPTTVLENPTAADAETTTKLGAQYDQPSNTVNFSVFSKNATLVRVYFYLSPLSADEVLMKDLTQNNDLWNISFSLDELKSFGIATDTDYVYYGYRAWGPNWPFAPNWQKGSNAGFISDVDTQGNRFNPNKLLIDPYARELSHDPEVAKLNLDPPSYKLDYYGGEDTRNLDTGRIAPKSILLLQKDQTDYGIKPKRALKDDVIYEVNLRGFSMLDDKIPQQERGTYKGAGQKAKYLKELGVTAIEFLPIHEFADAQNDDGDPKGDNYWGYMTINYFAPNKRYASAQNPGGPIREFKAMVKAFHDEGIKVFLDVVYNHTGEGILKRLVPNPSSRSDDNLQDPNAACYFSYAGLDNASYYFLRDGNRRYEGRGGCGGNLNYDNAVVQNLILDSLKYWVDEMGVDGFRFDLAPALSLHRKDDGSCDTAFDTPIFNKISESIPARAASTTGDGVDLIAEPWGIDNKNWADKFPPTWAMWNERYRDDLKKTLNKYGYDQIPISQISNRVAGSSTFIQKKAWNSINYLVSHDDTDALRSIFSYNRFWHLDEAKYRDDQLSWDQGGDIEAQKRATRNAFTLMMLSAGVPMFAGGDELWRAIPPYQPGVGKMNLVSVDRPEVYLDFKSYNQMLDYLNTGDQNAANQLIDNNDNLYLFTFVKNLLNFRNRHESLRRADYFTGAVLPNGLQDIAWYNESGTELNGTAWDRNDFISYRINAEYEKVSTSSDKVFSIYVAYNPSPGAIEVHFPLNLSGKGWYRVLDTDNTGGWMTKHRNFDDGGTKLGTNYWLHERSILVAVEK